MLSHNSWILMKWQPIHHYLRDNLKFFKWDFGSSAPGRRVVYDGRRHRSLRGTELHFPS